MVKKRVGLVEPYLIGLVLIYCIDLTRSYGSGEIGQEK